MTESKKSAISEVSVGQAMSMPEVHALCPEINVTHYVKFPGMSGMMRTTARKTNATMKSVMAQLNEISVSLSLCGVASCDAACTETVIVVVYPKNGAPSVLSMPVCGGAACKQHVREMISNHDERKKNESTKKTLKTIKTSKKSRKSSR
jgi:hypothetical protein